MVTPESTRVDDPFGVFSYCVASSGWKGTVALSLKGGELSAEGDRHDGSDKRRLFDWPLPVMLLPFVADRSWQPLSEPICAQLADALGGKDARWRHPSGNADVYGLEASEGDVAIYMHGVVGNSGEWVGVAVRDAVRGWVEYAPGVAPQLSVLVPSHRWPDIIRFALIKTKRRLTFDILYQHPDTVYTGEDDGPYYVFKASNGYEVISRSRMDIQTERLWLRGASEEERSGTMVFSSDEKRDKAYDEFLKALGEWANHVRAGLWGPPPVVA
ncbi:hypothetical protein [Ottowia sp.]|uniref:hypothetical protein n=1 Tax=Ottowia sp. TaxID=1898956 RepID=UPI0025CE64DE|nr:hypothetical protein [Ottowia sp.]MBK6616322.1 hypothetical protein [Ottowia sp.]